MSKFAEVDLWFTPEGDFCVDSKGDLKDTSSVYGRAVTQEIREYLKCNKGDWALAPSIGANLEKFRGRPLNESLKLEIEEAIARNLVEYGVVGAEEINMITAIFPDGTLVGRISISTPRGDFTLDLTYDSDRTIFAGY